MAYFSKKKIGIFNLMNNKLLKDKWDLLIANTPGFKLSNLKEAQLYLIDSSQSTETLKYTSNKVLIFILKDDMDLYSSFLRAGYQHFFFETEPEISHRQKMTYIKNQVYMQHQHQILNKVYDAAHNSIVITDLEGQIIFANHYFLNATGYTEDEVLGNFPSRIKGGVHSQEFYKDLWLTISGGNTWTGFFINKRKNDVFFYEEATITPIKDEEGRILQYLKIGKLVDREKLISHQLSSEIQDAKDLINYILPSNYQDHRLQFELKFKAHNYLGGDYVSFFKTNQDTYAFALIDVMGHGATSSLVGLKMITLFEALIEYESLQTTIDALNNAVVHLNRDNNDITRYLTGIFILFDPKDQSMTYINAGHPDLYLINRDDTIDNIPSNNLILGVAKDYHFRYEMLSYKNLASLFYYSDGLTECNPELSENNRDPLYDLLSKDHKSSSLLSHIFHEMTKDCVIDDDITLGRITFNK